MNKLRGVLIDVYNSKACDMTINRGLDSYYKILRCDTIDITGRRIGKRTKYFPIICDDEGLLKTIVKISAINDYGQPTLVGNLFITGGTDAQGNLVSLTDEEAKYVLSHVHNQATMLFPDPYPMLHQCH